MPKIDAFHFRRALQSVGMRIVDWDTDEEIGPRPVMRRIKEVGFAVSQIGVSAKNLQSFDFNVGTVIDVGVDAGTDFLYDAFPDTPFILFDPVEETKERVSRWKKQIDYSLYIVALGAEPGQIELVIPTSEKRKQRSRASVAGFAADYGEKFVDMEKRTVEQRTLDSYTKDITGSFGLKIDTEGNELAVIRGAKETLKRTEFVIAEVSVKRRFKNGYRFSEFVTEMGKNGFEIIETLRPPERDAPDCDLLFVPWDSKWFSVGDTS